MTVICDPQPVQAQTPSHVADRGMFISRQYCVCPRCETTIPVDCMLRHDLDEGQRDVGERRVSIYCPACFGAYTAWFAIAGGLFARQASPIAVIRDEALIDTLRGGLERVRGDRQTGGPRPPRVPEPVPVTAESVTSATLAELREQQEQTTLAVTQAQLSLTRERELVRKLTAERRIPPNATGCAPGGRKVEVAPSPVVPHRHTIAVRACCRTPINCEHDIDCIAMRRKAAALDIAVDGHTQGLAAETQTYEERRTIDHEFDQRTQFDSDFGA